MKALTFKFSNTLTTIRAKCDAPGSHAVLELCLTPKPAAVVFPVRIYAQKSLRVVGTPKLTDTKTVMHIIQEQGRCRDKS